MTAGSTPPTPDASAMAYQLALGAHTLATQVAAESKMHQNECVATRVRNESVFTEIKTNIAGVDTKLDQQTLMLMQQIDSKHRELTKDIDSKNEKLSDDQKKSNRLLYWIMGSVSAGANAPWLLKLLSSLHNQGP